MTYAFIRARGELSLVEALSRPTKTEETKPEPPAPPDHRSKAAAAANRRAMAELSGHG